MSHPFSKENAERYVPKIRARLEASASGYVRVSRVGQHDRMVLRVMIDRGEAEIFESPQGRAYRLIKAGEPR